MCILGGSAWAVPGGASAKMLAAMNLPDWPETVNFLHY